MDDSDENSRKRQPIPGRRRVNKPLIEKRRRARINDCLTELKTLVLAATNTQTARPSKLEKADILEMTVDFLRKHTPKPDEMEVKPKTNGENEKQYVDGYRKCVQEVSGFLTKTGNIDSEMKTDILNHIKEKVDRQSSGSELSDIKEEVAPAVLPPNNDATTTCTPSKVLCVPPTVSTQAQSEVSIVTSSPAHAQGQLPVYQIPSQQLLGPVRVAGGGNVLLLVQCPSIQQVPSGQSVVYLNSSTSNSLATVLGGAITPIIQPNHCLDIPKDSNAVGFGSSVVLNSNAQDCSNQSANATSGLSTNQPPNQPGSSLLFPVVPHGNGACAPVDNSPDVWRPW